ALDPDGDSLVYSFYPVMTTSPTSSVTYGGSWSYTNFLTAQTPPGITIDPVTGDICFTATQDLITVFGVKVEEYRNINGVTTKIGTVYRDMEMVVTTCNNNIPVLSGMDTTMSATYNPNDTTYLIEVCLSQDPIEFHINGFDADTLNPTTTGHPEKFSISWNNGIPGGTFTTYNNGTNSAYASFSWLPTAADVGNIKCFTATIQDEACPYNGFQTFSYCILVRGMLVDIGSDTLLCQGESFTVNAIADTTTVNYYWYMDGIISSNPPSQDWYLVNSSTLTPGTHTLTIETNDGGTTTVCPGVDQKIIDVVYQPHINGTLPDTAFCDGGSITYDAGQGTQYTWTDIVLNPLGASQTYTATNSGTYIVTVNGGTNTRCFDVDTFEVVSIPKPKLGNDTCIWSEDTPYKLDAGPIYGGLGYRWQDGSNQQYYDVTTTGKYSVEIYHTSISSTVGCGDSQNINVIDKTSMIQSVKIPVDQDSPLPGESPQGGDREICSHQRLKLIGPDAPSGYSYDYKWSNTLGGTVISTSAAYIFHEKVYDTYPIVLDAGGCIDSIKVTTKSCDVKVPNIITPNGDGANDFFKIVIMDDNGKPSDEGFYLSFPNSTLLIYNRWGKKIYESNNYQNDWNGNGAADGVYYWTLELQDGKNTQMQGTVTIISK
ncbi:MAG TPA: gliding motility-associated C-terminal domain-containing protein, partial [Leucothrix sp.]|nr:gliding motility-associated C-terminal domain-containing protein [Leucothrix sp.]